MLPSTTPAGVRQATRSTPELDNYNRDQEGRLEIFDEEAAAREKAAKRKRRCAQEGRLPRPACVGEGLGDYSKWCPISWPAQGY